MEGFNEEFPEVLNSVEQEKQNFVVEKFKEILDKKPQHERVVIDGHTKKEMRDEITLFYAPEAQAPGVLHLQREKKWMEIYGALRGGNPLVFTKEEDAKTTIEQLREIIQVYGEPKTIYYSRLDYDSFDSAKRYDCVLGAYFPFSEIEKDLGL